MTITYHVALLSNSACFPSSCASGPVKPGKLFDLGTPEIRSWSQFVQQIHPVRSSGRAKSGAEDPTADRLGLDANAENHILAS
ncbi:hypothetical protein N7481_004140 [Penicillium waksmanii]|uniref:uncharacterized protein n=1 Tax=Penicillium waksmanii TaxID=69791 RepID=UPI0025467E29|nr:uncharacterized protein N7481_004140 [Penicillium waksmanii]KAJ5988930.1 hypothetical protein N7481_004140 [Penicillium waksmanii]